MLSLTECVHDVKIMLCGIIMSMPNYLFSRQCISDGIFSSNSTVMCGIKSQIFNSIHHSECLCSCHLAYFVDELYRSRVIVDHFILRQRYGDKTWSIQAIRALQKVISPIVSQHIAMKNASWPMIKSASCKHVCICTIASKISLNCRVRYFYIHFQLI